jgi:uncharacterized protein YegL
MSEFMGRRLPVYLLLDCSGSMSGEPIEQVRQGIRALVQDLSTDPMALESAYLSVIRFDSTATQIVPLTELSAFPQPTLDASGSTALGAGLSLLEQCIDKEVRKTTSTVKGDWKPLVFIMTDGNPTDSWKNAAKSLKSKKLGNIIACAAGPNADSSILREITEIVVELNSLQPAAMTAFFKWVTDSIKTTSASIAQNPGEAPINLPPPPPVIQIVP